MNVKCFVTGGAGFIGSNLIDRLIAAGHEVTAYDNFSTGQETFLQSAKPHIKLIRGDVLDQEALDDGMKGCDIVFHISANADVRFGLSHPRRDLEQNTEATCNVLEAMRANNIKKIVFPSTGSVYGEPRVFPTPEYAPFPIQTSLYAASKLACEGMISAYCEGYGMQAWIFRFVSILGERYTHGHVFDFYRKLLANPNELHVLGDGMQRKSYLYIQDCIDAIFLALEKANDKVNIINLGTDEYCTVNQSIETITRELGIQPRLVYAGGTRGWVGDSPFIFLDCSRMRALGWQPKLKIQAGIIRTLRFLRENPWILEKR